MTNTGIRIEDRWKTRGGKVGKRWLFRVWDPRARKYKSKAFNDLHGEDGKLIAGSGMKAGHDWANPMRARIELREAGAGRWPLSVIVPSLLQHLKDEKSVETYRKQVAATGNALVAAHITDLADDALCAKVRAYITSPTQEGRRRNRESDAPAPSTIANRYNRVRSIVSHAMKFHGMRVDPLLGFVLPTRSRVSKMKRTAEQEAYTLDEVRAVLALDRWSDPIWLAFAIMVHTGLRIHEAMALQWSDLDWSAHCLRVGHGKGGKARVVPLTWSEDFLAAMDRLGGPAARQPRAGGKVIDYKFKRMRTNVHLEALLDDADVERDRGVSEISGLPRNLTWHSCRRSCAAALLASGTDSLEIQRGLGHEDSAMSGHYAATFTVWKHQVEAEGWPRGKLCLLRAPGVAVVPKAGG